MLNKSVPIITIIILSLLVACNGPDSGSQRELKTMPKQSGALKLKSIPQQAGELGPKDEPIGPIATDLGMQKMIDLGRQDLARRLAIDEKLVQVVEANYVTWRDGSIGCPQPSERYPQVLKHGVRLKLRAEFKTYHYHSGGKRPLFYCRTPSSIEPLPYEHGET